MLDSLFHPLVAGWFRRRFGEPTDPQRRGWPEIVAGRNTLIAAPTGSGKTLAAFLACIDQLLRDNLAGKLEDRTYVLYISPLKALSSDIHRNLEVPLAELGEEAAAAGHLLPPMRSGVRTGDTPTSQRAAMLRRQPHILVTTPESFYLLLTSPKSRETLRSVRTVIVDEIHALARDKRGSHLALSLERLEQLCEERPVRIGLSATQAPIEAIGRFLVGVRADATGQPECRIIDGGHQRQIDLRVEVPPAPLAAVCSNETWGEIYARLCEQITTHRSTLVFVNTRRMSERVTHHLAEALGEDAVASHHGSLARHLRHSAEERLKAGELKAIVATASLEMGIDIGYIDLVCQLGSPRAISTLLQRVGRSGHSLGKVPCGRLFPLTRDELLECLALVRAVRQGRLDKIEIPHAPLDILAQQIVAMTACDDWDEDELFELCRQAAPYAALKREDYDATLDMLAKGISSKSKAGAYLHRDRIANRLRARKHARLAAITSGGAIPEVADFRVVTADEGTFVGTLNEDFAIESLAGDIFLLGNSSWRIEYVRGGEVVVTDAHGAPATVPFWLGEAPGRTVELSAEVSGLNEEIGAKINGGDSLAASLATRSPEGALEDEDLLLPAMTWLEQECNADRYTAWQAARYVAAQKAAIGFVPTQKRILFERFFDEAGGMQLVIHSPWGTRINRAWGLALRKRFCRSFDFELQASAGDNGVVLSLGPQHSFAIESLFKMLTPANAKTLLEQAMLAAPLFQTRWRWNLTRSLAVLRFQGGKKVPPQLQRFRSDDLLAAVFPASAGCLENHSGDIEIPDHPLMRQTVHDCLHEAMDLDRWIALLQASLTGEIELVPCDTREPSPFSHELLNSNPYAFLDPAPLEERRARAVATRRSLSLDDMRELARLDPQAIAQVRAEAWPTVRDPDELHDVLDSMCLVRADEARDWLPHFEQLTAAGRATRVVRADSPECWIAAERWPLVESLFPEAKAQPPLDLPERLRTPWQAHEAVVALVRGRMPHLGPLTAEELAQPLGLSTERASAALEALEGEGLVIRGRFTAEAYEPQPAKFAPDTRLEWCDRRLLARIHRRTLDGLRRQIQPVEPADYIRFLCEHQHLTDGARLRGRGGVRKVLAQLQGYELAAGLWERRVLAARVEKYDPRQLDELSMSGELVWGRLRPPRKDEEQGPSAAVITRAVPIALALRENLAWLLPADRASLESFARSGARQVLEALSGRGALFQHELLAVTSLLPTHLAEALFELAALGLVTADAFAAVRSLAKPERIERLRRRKIRTRRSVQPSGRWTLFPGLVTRSTEQESLQHWAKQLLSRWGVVFRDLLQREPAAPPWGRLLPVFRKLEAQGEIRGGRFVAGVGGEQYALGAAVEQLRQMKDQAPSGKTLVLAAADPASLCGLITTEPRIAATHTNTVALRDGRLIASSQAGEVQFHVPLPTSEMRELERSLRQLEHVEPENAEPPKLFPRRRIS